MKTRCIEIAVVLLLVAPLQAAELRGKVVAIADGDTITVLDADKVQHKVRLNGIDAPEKKQAFGTKSRQHLGDLIHEKEAGRGRSGSTGGEAWAVG